MTSDAFFLGVDGGGTKTQFVCIDADGGERAAIRAGTCYHPEIGLDEAIRRLREGLIDVCRNAGTTPAALRHVFFGLPAFGEDRVADARLTAACGAMLGHDRYTCDNDMVCGWAGAFGGDDGINIVAGTGSIGYGQCRGRAARAGGWGEVFSDEGSAYWIALQGLMLFSRMSDGRQPIGALYGLIRDGLPLHDDLDLCQWVLGPPARSRNEIAALAPLVSTAAMQGDEAAGAILDLAADHLMAIAQAVRARLDFAPGPVPLSWSGSILAKVAPVRRRFVALAKAAGFAPAAPRHEPGHGVALYTRTLYARPSATAALQTTARGAL